jgi:hypothetical protein
MIYLANIKFQENSFSFFGLVHACSWTKRRQKKTDIRTDGRTDGRTEEVNFNRHAAGLRMRKYKLVQQKRVTCPE